MTDETMTPGGGDGLDRFRALMEAAAWKFAKTMPHNPHHYTLREGWESDEEFCWCVRFIREHGVIERFRGRDYTVLVVGGFKYWTMGDPIRESRTDPRGNTILINRKVYDPERP